MVVMDIPKLMPDRTVQWVRVTVTSGHVVCPDDAIRRKVEALKPIHGPSGADPEPDWTLARRCALYMAARIVKQTPTGSNNPLPPGVVP
jgi:hypothetical protein